MKISANLATAVMLALGCLAFGRGLITQLISSEPTAGLSEPGTTEYPDLSLEHIGPPAASAGEISQAVVIDPEEEFAYFSVAGDHLSIVKMKLPGLDQTDIITIPETGYGSPAAVLDPVSGHAFFAFNSFPRRIVGVDLADFTVVGNSTIDNEGELRSASIGPEDGEVTFFTNSPIPGVITIDSESGEVVEEREIGGWNLGVLHQAMVDRLSDAVYVVSNEETTYRTAHLSEYIPSDLERKKVRSIPNETAFSFAQETQYGNFVLGTRATNYRLRTLSRLSFNDLQNRTITHAPRAIAVDSQTQIAYVGFAGNYVNAYRLGDLVHTGDKNLSFASSTGALRYLPTRKAVIWTDYRAGYSPWIGNNRVSRPFNDTRSIQFLFADGGKIYGKSTELLEFEGSTGLRLATHTPNGLSTWNAGAIIPGANAAIIGTNEAPAKLLKVSTATWETSDSLKLNEGENAIRVVLHDAKRGVVYAAGDSSLARIIKVDVSTLERLDTLRLDRFEENISGGFIDSDARYGYFTTDTTQGNFVRVDLESFERSGSIVLDSASPGYSAVTAHYDPVGNMAYVRSTRALTQIDLARFRWEKEIRVEGMRYLALDHDGRSLYFTSESNYQGGTFAGIHKVGLDDFDYRGMRPLREDRGDHRGLIFLPESATLHVGSMQTIRHRRTAGYRVAHTNTLNASPFELTETAYVNDMRFYSHAAGGNLRLALYSGDESRELLWESAVVANNAEEDTVTVPIASGTPSTLALDPGTYYVAWQSDSTVDAPSFTEAPGGLRLWMPFGPSPSALGEDAEEVERVWTQYITYTTTPPAEEPPPVEEPPVEEPPVEEPPVEEPPVEEPGDVVGLFSSWYFAEGAVYPQFDTYYLVANPHAEAIEVEVELLPESGAATTFTRTIPAESRLTIRANDHVSNTGVSAILREKNNKTFAAERAMYSIGEDGKWRGAHATVGITELGSDWYLAEGSTAQAGPAMNPFEYFILLANPNEVDVTTDLTFFLQGDEAPVTAQFTIPAKRRITVFANNLDSRLYERSFSTRVQTPNGEPIAVERSMWWRAANWPDTSYMEGNASPGITELSTSWYLAEGNTSDEEFILLANPGTTDADVTVRYLLEGSDPVTRTLTVPAQRRRTINVRYDAEGLGIGLRHGTEITSNAPIAVERSQYFSNGGFGWVGGHHSVASPTLTKQWVLPEGAEVPVGTSWLRTEFLVANPGADPANVQLRFLLGNGDLITESLTVPAGQRATFTAGNVKALGGKAFGTHIISDQPIVAERSMYFGLDEIDRIGATCSMGIPLMPQVPTKVYGEPVLQIAGPAHVLQTHTPTPTLTPTPTPTIP